MQQRFVRWSITDLVLIAALFALACVLLQWSYRPSRSIGFTMNTPEPVTPHRAFHGVEKFPDSSRLYRWTTGKSGLELPNPGGTALVHIALAGGPAGTVPVALQHDAAQLLLRVAPDIRTYSLLLPPAPGERINLWLLSPAIVTPERAIGIVVSNGYLAGGAVVPIYVLLLTPLLMISGYSLLRWSGWRAVPTAGYSALILGIAIFWQRLGGWQYGLFAVLLAILAQASITLMLMYRAATHSEQSRALALIAIAINSIFYTTLYFAMPVGKIVVFREDSFVENISAAWFALSVVFGLSLLLRSKQRSRAVLGIVPLFALICLLDEMSFGERFFALNMPIFYDVKFDGLHDIVDILVVWLSEPARYRVELAIVLALGLLIALVLLRQIRQIGAGLAAFRAAPSFIFFTGSLLLLMAALLIDTELYPNQVALGLIEELLELNAATSLLFAASTFAHPPSYASAPAVPPTMELRGSSA